jgi:hypothetical protein
LVAALGAGCGDDPTTPGPGLDAFAGDTTLALSSAAGAAIAIGVARRGFTFFDNFYACPGRGLLDFAERGAVMQARAHGCDLGTGVVLDGDFEVRLRSSGATVVGVHVTGNAEVVSAAGAIDLPDIAIDGLGVELFEGRSALVDPNAATLYAFGRRVAYDARGIPAEMFAASAAVSNPAGDLSSFTEDDLRRVVFDPALVIASILFDEQVEFGRGPHTHDIGCGTLDVMPDTLTGLTGMTASLVDCEIPFGTGIGGDFRAAWTAFDESGLALEIDGTFVLQGGLPSVSLQRASWIVELDAALEEAVFRGEVSDGAITLPYSYRVPVSD